ncbi:DUF262 domain-containing protein [Ferruginibacter sp.]
MKRYSTMKVTQSPVTLDLVLSDLNFEVPLYQREYSWELEQVSDLFYDIDTSYENEGYFLGSILLYVKDESKKLMEIIDGQQRLTTIFLILYTIKKAIAGTQYTKAIESINNLLYQRTKSLIVEDTGEEPRLTTGKRDKKLFKAILKSEDIDKKIKDGRVKSHKLLFEALESFITPKIEKIKTERGIEGVIKFADKVLSTEYIVMTAEQKSDKILLFKTLNARGIELSQSDLIKNEVCNNPKGITEEEAVELWDDTREILEKIKANIDIFLFHFINSRVDSLEIRKRIEEKRNVQHYQDSYPPVPEKYIFDVYDEKLKALDNTETFLNELKESALHYVEIVNPTPDKIYLNGLKTLNVAKCYPLLLRAKNVLNNKNFEALTKAIECISFRHQIIRRDPKELEKLYYTLLTKLKSDNDINIVIDEIRQNPTMKLEDKFKSGFCLSSPKSNIAKLILERIVASKQESVSATGDAWLEHIMPQKPKGNWLKLKESDPELYTFSLNRLGNLTLLKNKLNIVASNKDFDTKKIEYEKSRLTINNDLKDYSIWDYDTIDTRQDYLYELSKDIWKI